MRDPEFRGFIRFVIGALILFVGVSLIASQAPLNNANTFTMILGTHQATDTVSTVGEVISSGVGQADTLALRVQMILDAAQLAKGTLVVIGSSQVNGVSVPLLGAPSGTPAPDPAMTAWMNKYISSAFDATGKQVWP